MREIANVEVHALSKELDSLRGFHVEKFYEVEPNSFRLKLKSGPDQRNIVILLPYTVNESEFTVRSDEPTNFALAVRKRITGTKVESVEQYKGDRIILIKLEKGEESWNLFIELFGKGNLILADQDLKIALAYLQHQFKERSIKVGSTYSSPQKMKSEKPRKAQLINAVSANFNLGTAYIEDAILRCNADPKADAASVPKETISKIEERLAKAQEAKIEPTLYLDEAGRPINYSIFPLKKYEALKSEAVPRLQSALDRFYREHGESQPDPDLYRKVKELELSIQKQRSLVDEVRTQSAENKRAGQYIFANMARINELIGVSMSKKRPEKGELQSMFPELKIVELNLKDKTITLDVNDD